MRSLSFVVLGAFGVALLSACADKPPTEPKTAQTVAQAPPPAQPTQARNDKNNTVHVSGDLEKQCNIVVGSVAEAPKFDFDQDALLAQDRAVLDQVAKCVTTGPLKGRSLKLTGRADNRGTGEYNLALGAHRANTVERYLAADGVASPKLHETSRGELDAKGSDETSRRDDRRVDIDLAQ